MPQASKNGVNQSFLTVVKFDLAGDVREWKQEGQYPGEPVFVARPDAQSENEDDGILMTVVLDAPQTTRIFCCSTHAICRRWPAQPFPSTCRLVFTERIFVRSFVGRPVLGNTGKRICKTSLQKPKRKARANRSSSFLFLTERRFYVASSTSRSSPSPVPRMPSSRS